MQFYSLNQIINLLETIAGEHAQVADFGFGRDFNISASEQQLYPLVWVDVKPPSISEKTITIPMSILVIDIQKADATNEKDTLSDCLSIAQDIYAELTNYAYDDYFLLDTNVSFEDMREALPDLVNGWRMTVNFNLEQIRDRCQIPLA